MNAALIAVGSGLALLCAGCSKIEMARMDNETGRDAVLMVQRYKEASISQVEPVLNEYLALADGYEKRGWDKYGNPGCIEHLRAMCEGRLAVFFKASGKQDLYRLHMDRAVGHLRKRSPVASDTDQEVAAQIEELVNGLDSKNIDPSWRKQLGQPNRAANQSQPVGAETNRPPVAAGSGR
ncbi:MAG TPA: hypothetical protein VN578_05845 [Candidatus Binatia bacterium]|jgi:hypothetical protein|nr:hypothetical protein [Candidatus Binatia bacterium]